MVAKLPRGAARAIAAALLLVPLLCARPSAGAASPGAQTTGPPSYEQRASAEKTTRSRYRRLEIASAILIVAAGGAVIYWAIRRK